MIRHALCRMPLVALLLFAARVLTAGETSAEPADPLRYLVALDFKSDFDDGKLGRAVGRMFRSKSTKRQLFSVDTEIDWEERSPAMKAPALDADPVAVAKAAREAFGCDVIVWGEIEQPEIPGAKVVKQHQGYSTTARSDQGLRLVLHVRAIDLDREPIQLAVEKRYECAINFELTQKVDEVLKLLTGAPTPADLEAAHVKQRMEASGPNLCPLGSMNAEADAGDAPWDALAGWHFPMREGITLAGNAGNRYLQYRLSQDVAGTTGLFCYTPYIPIEPETYYQVSFRVRSLGPKVIMFVKGYRDLEVKGYERVETLRQEVFKHQKRLYGAKGEWQTLTTEPFLPRSARPEHMPQFLRVQLYAYWPQGEVFFDDVVVRACREQECAPAPEVQERPTAVPEETRSGPLPHAKPERLDHD